jgi:hypothetical protein
VVITTMSQRWPKTIVAVAMATTPAATSRAETSSTGSGKEKRPLVVTLATPAVSSVEVFVDVSRSA